MMVEKIKMMQAANGTKPPKASSANSKPEVPKASKNSMKKPTAQPTTKPSPPIQPKTTGPAKAPKPAKAANKPEENEDGEDEDEYKWWEEEEIKWDNTIKWTSLEHSGVFFPPEYVPHGVTMRYDGQEIGLEPEAEEVAGFFAALINTDYAANPIFVNNFFDDFTATLHKIDSKFRHLITEFVKCDFTPMAQYFDELKEARKAMSKDEKDRVKEEKKQIEEKFGWCLWNGRKEKVGNFRIEPPGLFRGRGKHPKAGKLKQRIAPEQITINIGNGCRVPEPPQGRSWGAVVHNNTVGWLATWTENINNSTKYVLLAATSSLKGQSDFKKFETARELKKHINLIRNRNAEELRSKEMMVRQRATALWLIDRLALRAGNEKGDDEADTVGCCSLRLEHVSLKPPTTVVFDFLGKDSIRYFNEVEVDPIIVKNLSIFMRPPKVATDPIFDRLTTSSLNKYLTELMPGLTAKVFRTFNASFTMQQELDKIEDDTDAPVAEKILGYNRANRRVAILCNHQRSVPKSHEQSMEKLKERMLMIKYQRLLVKRELRQVLDKKEWKQCAIAEDESDIDEEVEARKAKEIEELEADRHNKKLVKLKAEGKLDGDDPDSYETAIKRSPKRAASAETLKNRLESLTQRLNAARHNATDREENKTTSLGTSKINYIDPRITSSWAKLHDVPIERMFTRALREKFKWAMGADESWKF